MPISHRIFARRSVVYIPKGQNRHMLDAERGNAADGCANYQHRPVNIVHVILTYTEDTDHIKGFPR